MFTRPIVFIIGAGASAEFGLPLGIRLRDEVASFLDSGSRRQTIPLRHNLRVLYSRTYRTRRVLVKPLKIS